MRSSGSLLTSAAALSALLVSACSVLNAPDDIVPGGGGGTSTTGPTVGPATTGTATTGGGGGGTPDECQVPADCDPGDCQEAACEAGRCVLSNLAAGVACGPAAAECVGAGVCDGSGTCVVQNTEGASCTTCDGEPSACVCRAGACTSCDVPAEGNLFADPDLIGWDVTGGWGLYTRFPRDRQAPTEVPIGKRVLGTDGNRAHPYPGGLDALVGGELEVSSATSPPTELPAQLTFRSWHEDEGGIGGRDNKQIILDVQGVIRVLVDCAAGIEAAQPFCAPPPGGLVAQRAADDWDTITLNVPANLVGQVGRIAFHYDTLDADGGRERGWFIDALGAAGRCGCAVDGDCAYLDTPCSEGVCDTTLSACTFTARAGSAGNACGSSISATCSLPDACDEFGLCSSRDKVDSTACTDCDGGDCQACGAGECLACQSPVQSFDGPNPTNGWDLGGGAWSVRANAPASSNPSVAFATQVFGTTGVGASSAITLETAIPEVLTFRSWHVDEGGGGGRDKKTISVVVPGQEPIVILDCQNGPNDDLALCAPVPGPRAAAAFDDISVPTGDAAGAVGRIVFGYDDGGVPQTFEQGWYIDDLNAVRCP